MSETDPAVRVSTVLDGSRDALAGLGAWIEAATAGHGLPPDSGFALRLAIEEAATNVVEHGLAQASDRNIAICVNFRADAVTVEIEDGGSPFDPTMAPMTPLAATLDDAPAGGRGLRLLRGFSDCLKYERQDGRNRLSMTFRRR